MYYEAFISVTTIIILPLNNNKKIVKHIKMVNFTKHKLRQIAERRGIKNCTNIYKKELLTAIEESKERLDRIAEIQNLLQSELEQIAKMRRIKNYKHMSKEDLLIALLKSEQSLAELYKSKFNNAKIEETKKGFN